MKIGIIQPYVTPGDFPRNVRAIIEAYRACLDDGADLVAAPAMSLSGPEPEGLLHRSAYAREHEDALRYMALEMGKVPLIMGSVEGLDGAEHPSRRFYVLTQDSVSKLDEFPGVIDVNNIGVCLVNGRESLEEISSRVHAELILYFPEAPWSMEQTVNIVEAARRTATGFHLPVGVIRHAGGRGETVDAGSSFLIDGDGRVCGVLAPFLPDERVVNTIKPGKPSFPGAGTALNLAIKAGIRDFISKGGYAGAVLMHADTPEFRLLESLVTEAQGESPCIWESAPDLENPLNRAETANLLLLSPCHKNALFHGARPEAHYLPFGDLFGSDLKGGRPGHFRRGSEDDILHSLVDLHRSGTDLITEGYSEIDVRSCQRAVERSAWSRRQSPPLLHLYGMPVPCPLLHRFSD
ncbi:hypothetical protein QET93_008920 [Akkermansia sp. N21116]|jgi:predicted amidohydrolase|uniref:hypothetical protein n=1 Tax=Akkermansia sp. N21116 TaxID=3040764 RepID=UPI00244EEEEE|nr:hypothetical protein [Akkermansia sp. N21116]WPX39656.1 hypothetical protein QET93_008920 [Akkermansia sp. N21116]